MQTLTDSQMRVALLVAQDLTDQEIADRLGISVRTVNNYMPKICERLNCRSRVGVAVWVVRNSYDLDVQ